LFPTPPALLFLFWVPLFCSPCTFSTRPFSIFPLVKRATGRGPSPFSPSPSVRLSFNWNPATFPFPKPPPFFFAYSSLAFFFFFPGFSHRQFDLPFVSRYLGLSFVCESYFSPPLQHRVDWRRSIFPLPVPPSAKPPSGLAVFFFLCGSFFWLYFSFNLAYFSLFPTFFFLGLAFPAPYTAPPHLRFLFEPPAPANGLSLASPLCVLFAPVPLFVRQVFVVEFFFLSHISCPFSLENSSLPPPSSSRFSPLCSLPSQIAFLPRTPRTQSSRSFLFSPSNV